MHCANCDAPNDADARFCYACGKALGAAPATYVISHAPMAGPACPACRQRNPAGALYCVFCATPLTPATPITPAPGFRPAQMSYTAGAIAQTGLMQGPNLLIRAIWFFLVGWWLGLIWTIIAWVFNLTLIGLPVGALMLNAIPIVTTLHQPRQPLYKAPSPTTPQLPLAIRALWFLFVGSWASLLWVLTAWAFALSIFLMPIAFWMYNRVPTVTTLAAEP